MTEQEEYLVSRGWKCIGGEWHDQQGNPWGVDTEGAVRIEKESEHFQTFLESQGEFSGRVVSPIPVGDGPTVTG